MNLSLNLLHVVVVVVVIKVSPYIDKVFFFLFFVLITLWLLGLYGSKCNGKSRCTYLGAR